MATFTDQEYADTERIRLGYHNLQAVLVPYLVDQHFSALNRVIISRSRLLGIDVPENRFRCIDGATQAHSESFSSEHNAPTFLEQVLESQFAPTRQMSSRELLLALREQARSARDGTAMIYIQSEDHSHVPIVMQYKKDSISVFFCSRKFDPLGHWEDRDLKSVYGDPSMEFSFDEDGITRDGYSINGVLRDAGLAQGDEVPERDINAKWNISLMEDKGVYRDDMMRDLATPFEQAVVNDHDAATMCLMATQDWVLPTYTYQGNVVQNYNRLREALGDDYIVGGNCVEQSIALAINSNGGIRDNFVHPRMRIIPSREALEADPPRINLYTLDPLHHQTLRERMFGKTPNRMGGGDISEQGITEAGALVYIAGHQFYAKKSGDEIDVYDMALSFCGPYKDYEKYLLAQNMSPSLLGVNHVVELDPRARDFYRMCKRPYLDKDVVESAMKIFSDDHEHRSAEDIFVAWNKALYDRPEVIATAMSDEKKVIGCVSALDEKGDLNAISPDTIDNMIDNQDTCFFVGSMSANGTTTPFVFFKKDGHQFLSAGGNANFFKEGATELFSDSSMDFHIASFGGNDLARMQEAYGTTVARAATVPLSIND